MTTSDLIKGNYYACTIYGDEYIFRFKSEIQGIVFISGYRWVGKKWVDKNTDWFYKLLQNIRTIEEYRNHKIELSIS